MTDELWQPCPANEIGRMVDTLAVKRRRRVIHRYGVVACVVMFLATTMGLATRHFFAPDAISCREVVGLFEDYQQNALNNDLMRRISHHLNHCPHCQESYQQLRDSRGQQKTDLEIAQPFALARAASRPTRPPLSHRQPRDADGESTRRQTGPRMRGYFTRRTRWLSVSPM